MKDSLGMRSPKLVPGEETRASDNVVISLPRFPWGPRQDPFSAPFDRLLTDSFAANSSLCWLINQSAVYAAVYSLP